MDQLLDRHSASRFHPDTLPGVDSPRSITFLVRIIMNASLTTTHASIGSASLSSVVVSAVIGAPRGF